MGFVQSGLLLGLVALAVPVLMHLLSRWQVRRVELGTMRFLQEVIHDAAHRRRVRRWLLLVTRLVVVVALVLLFARPYLPTSINQGNELLKIVLVDRSASMSMPGQNGRLIDDAIAEATKVIDRAGSNSKIELAWFDRHVEALPAETLRPTATREISGDTDYAAALRWARDRAAAVTHSAAEVVLITDMQLTGLAGEQGDAVGKEEENTLDFPPDLPVRIVDVGRAEANNIAIVGLRTPSVRMLPRTGLKVTATFFNYGSLAAEDIPVNAIAVSGSKSIRLKKPLNVVAAQTGELVFDFGEVGPGTWEITIDVDANDDLVSDNRRITSVDIAAPLKVLVVDPGHDHEHGEACSYYLLTALKQTVRTELPAEPHADLPETKQADADEADLQLGEGEQRFAVEQWFVKDRGEPTAAALKVPLVVIADASSLSAQLIERLGLYASSGGRLLIFAGPNAAAANSPRWLASGLAPGELIRTENASTMPYRIVSVSDHGTMLAPFRDPQYGDLSRLAFTSFLKTEVKDADRVLAWFDGKRPAITEHTVGNGKVAWFLSSADNRSGNWTTSPLYLPLVRQMANDLLGLTGEGPLRFRHVGDELPEVHDVTLHHQKQAAPADPVITSVADRMQNHSADLFFSKPGFMRTPDALYVVNTLAKESDPTRIDSESFATAYNLTLANGKDENDERIAKRATHELWPWFAAVTILLLMAEFALANRTPA